MNFRDKAREVGHRLVELMVALTTVAVVAGFAISQGLMLSQVVNALRLDSYISVGVGVEMVFLIFSLVWIPAWMLAYAFRSK
jgi:hypothetical protein